MHQSLAVNVLIFFYKKSNSAVSNSEIQFLIVYIILYEKPLPTVTHIASDCQKECPTIYISCEMHLSTKTTFPKFREPVLDFANTKIFEFVVTPHNNIWFGKRWTFDVPSY